MSPTPTSGVAVCAVWLSFSRSASMVTDNSAWNTSKKGACFRAYFIFTFASMLPLTRRGTPRTTYTCKIVQQRRDRHDLKDGNIVVHQQSSSILLSDIRSKLSKYLWLPILPVSCCLVINSISLSCLNVKAPRKSSLDVSSVEHI